MKITLQNKTHHTSVVIDWNSHKISMHQARRIDRELCGRASCHCQAYVATRLGEKTETELLKQLHEAGVQ